MQLPLIHLILVSQLLVLFPKLILEVLDAEKDLVVFVDAALVGDANEAVRVLPLVAEPSPAPNPNSHALAPAELLTLTGWLYGHVPKAMLVAVTGYDFSFGESLSAEAESLVPEATNAVLGILREFDRSFTS